MNRRELIELISTAIAGAATISLADIDGSNSMPKLPLILPFRLGKFNKNNSTVELIVDAEAFKKDIKQIQRAIRSGVISENAIREKLNSNELFKIVHIK